MTDSPAAATHRSPDPAARSHRGDAGRPRADLR